MDVGVSGQEGAAASRGEQLGAAEAQDAHVAPGSCLTSLDGGAGHLGGILDHAQAVSIGKLHDFSYRHHAAVQMGDDHGAGSWTNGSFYLLRRQVPVGWIDVDQHWNRPDRMDV